ncbi:TadG family pilus assembly protein [Taklimakanibacter lacteus]|uniref:TadG family pilus assembly protein n=1 Tax=Taklimakanibacter lacteus TaxID=2268456 RepID=UPI000E66D16B
MNFRNRLGSLSRSEDGTVAIISAIVMTVMIGFAAIAVDVASIHFDNRRLQGATDLAAIAAASNTANATQAASATFTDNGGWVLNSLTVETGNYDPSSTKPLDQRFVADQLPINAARVVARADSPIYFARIFQSNDVGIAASAIATRPAEAAFSIGSRLLSLEGGIINAILGQMLGGNVNLRVMDYRSLADVDIDLLKFMDQLAIEADIEAGTYQQVLDADLTAGNILSAMARTARTDSNLDAAEALEDLAQALSGSTPVDLTRLLSIGKAANAQIGTSSQYGLAAAVNALQMVNALALVSNGTHQVDVDLGATIPGLTNTQLSLVIGEPPQGTSWITVGEKGAFVRTAQTRIKLTVEVGGTGLLAATKIRLPIFIDVAYAEGRLAAVTCGATPATHQVTVATQPGILNTWIGEVTNFTAVNETPSVNAAQLVDVAGLVRISGSAHINVGNMSAQNLVFSATDISNRTYKTAVTQNYTQSLVTSLAENLNLSVNVLNLPDLLGLLANQYKALVRSLLLPVTPALDTIVYTTLTTLGIRLGEADVTVHGVRCNNPVVVQ